MASLGEKKSYGVHETLSKSTPRFIRYGVASHGENKNYGVHETLSKDAPHFIRHGVASRGEKKSYGEHETLSKNAQMGLASLRFGVSSLRSAKTGRKLRGAHRHRRIKVGWAGHSSELRSLSTSIKSIGLVTPVS